MMMGYIAMFLAGWFAGVTTVFIALNYGSRR